MEGKVEEAEHFMLARGARRSCERGEGVQHVWWRIRGVHGVWNIVKVRRTLRGEFPGGEVRRYVCEDELDGFPIFGWV